MCDRWDGGAAAGRHGSAWIAGFAVVLACVMAGVPAQAAEACPNEALRAESRLNPETHLPLSIHLPDCRAYEVVSPPYKEGYPVAETLALSEDGRSLIGASLGTFAGTEAGEGVVPPIVYDFTRMGSGWVASPLEPAPARFPVDLFKGGSTNLARTLWGLGEPSQSVHELTFYLREPDGSFVRIGPYVPSMPGPPAGYYYHPETELGGSPAYRGASSDLSRVLFTLKVPASLAEQSFLWPGDTTSGYLASSLYEYVGTGKSQPELVGVKNDGGVISDCGTLLGGEHDEYNAVSVGGGTVFFTALAGGCKNYSTGAPVSGPAANELYARRDGSETVAISEPTPTQCTACLTSIRRGAEFQGASADGSKVLFVTEQELFVGDTTTNLYEYDFNNPEGEKIERVSTGSAKPEVQGVARVSQDGSHVYFVARGVLTTEPDPSLPASHREAVAGADNLYVFERDASHPAGHVRFISRLCSENGKSGVVAEAGCHGSDEADWQAGDTRPVQTTPDGRFLVFESAGDLTADDTSTVSQVFEYDAQEEQLVRISVGQMVPGGYECKADGKIEAGYNCDGNTEVNAAEIPIQDYETQDLPTAAESNLALSSDGSYVFFTSHDALTPQVGRAVEESEHAKNVYEYHGDVDESGGSIAGGNVYLISDGRDVSPGGQHLLGTSASGDDVFFDSGDPLVAQETDTQINVYDARVDGGFPAPMPPVGCEGEGCLGGPSAAPLFAAPGSSTISGSGNLTAPPIPVRVTPKPKPKPVKCKRGFVKKHNKCSKNKKKKAQKEPATSAGQKR